MNNLKEYKFNTLYTMSSGISSKPEQAGHGSPFLSFSTVFNSFFLPSTLSELMDTSEKEQITYSIKSGDIFLTRTSETIDELGMSCVALKDYPSATYSGFLKRLRPNQRDITHEKYMGFYLRSTFFRKTMTNNANMTLRASLNEEIFSYLKLYLPDYNTQKIIGEFLFSIDSKIELNKRLNAELEAMATTLYSYWFEQFNFPDQNNKPYKASGGQMVWSEKLKREIPRGWNVNKLGSLYDVQRGTNITRKTIVDGDIPVIAAGIDPSCYHNVANTLAPVITISGSGANAGYIQLHFKNIWASDCSFIDINTTKYVYINYLFLKKRQEVIYNMQKGSAQPHVYPKDIMALDMVVPPDFHVYDRFLERINPIFNEVGKLKIQNQKLSELRDWLLPMLMNGQVTLM